MRWFCGLVERVLGVSRAKAMETLVDAHHDLDSRHCQLSVRVSEMEARLRRLEKGDAGND